MRARGTQPLKCHSLYCNSLVSLVKKPDIGRRLEAAASLGYFIYITNYILKTSNLYTLYRVKIDLRFVSKMSAIKKS